MVYESMYEAISNAPELKPFLHFKADFEIDDPNFDTGSP
jgi:hypothetical protein